jgi:hypothetical protein
MTNIRIPVRAISPLLRDDEPSPSRSGVKLAVAFWM